jgi:hypothetical protein
VPAGGTGVQQECGVTALSDNGARADRAIGGLVRDAIRQFAELSGLEPEKVSGVRSSESGWSILIDVVELERIPATTSVMCTYRVDVDSDAQLTGFERLRRFTRATTDGR